MSHDKKMRDLMARLVSMAPEPPPYPVGDPMARSETQRSPRPALVFAGAAALVIALAIPLLLFTGGEPPPAATSTTTTEPSTDSTQAALPVWSQPVFVYQTPVDSFLSNPALVPIWLEVVSPDVTVDSQFTTVLAAIGSALPEPFQNAIPPDVEILELSTADTDDGSQIRVADMNEAFLEGAGGMLADTTMLNQLVYTITQGTPDIEGVLFRVNGEPVEEFGSEGMILTDPITRETFREELSVIFLTESLLESEGVYVVEGMSNTFEATLIVNVLDGDGEAVHEEFVQATSGSGTWGTFSATIGADLVVPGESSISVFQYSPEDGSPVDVVTVPIPEGDVWQLTVGG